MSIDISIITKNVSRSLKLCIDYIESRQITYELIDDVKDAKGEFIFDNSQDLGIFYHNYFLHYQYLLLTYLKGSNKCDSIDWKYITVFEMNEDLDFYTGDFRGQNKFYRRVPKFKNKAYIEDKVPLGCTHIKFEPVEGPLPDDKQLYEYYFWINEETM